jgi:protein-disulfide isomerase
VPPRAPAVLFLLAAACAKEVKPPGSILAEIDRTPAGSVTIVEFLDFECPFCERTHFALAPVLAEHPGRIRLVRKQVPLVRIHPHALTAARAYVCAEEAARGDAMADALFSAPVTELTPEGCAALAARVGLDAPGFRACLDDPRTLDRIKRDIAEFDAAGLTALPTVYVGARGFVGEEDTETLRAAVDEALDRR